MPSGEQLLRNRQWNTKNILFSGKGPNATRFSPMSRNLEDFGKNVRDYHKQFVINEPSPFP